MIYTVTLNPALDKTVVIPSFEVNRVNRITGVRLDPGGKGINVSKMITSLGGTSVAIVALGGMAGQQWEQMSQGCGFSLYVIPAEGETRTNIKIVDPAKDTHTDVNESGAAIAADVLEALVKWLADTLLPGDILVMSGSVPASVGTDIYGRLTALCRDRGGRAIVDGEGPLLTAALAAGPYLVKPNHHELAGYVGYSLYTVEDMVEAACQMLDAGAQHVLVSMGSEGALLCWYDERNVLCQCYVQAPQVSVVNTVGAGDSMVGAVAYGLEQNMPWEEILRWAVAAGTAAVICEGSQAPEYSLIEDMRKRMP